MIVFASHDFNVCLSNAFSAVTHSFRLQTALYDLIDIQTLASNIFFRSKVVGLRGTRVRAKRLIVLCVLLIASVWVALVNGQPLFHPDLSAYLRGPDFAFVYLFGKNVSTSWTQKRTLEGIQDSTQIERGKSAARGVGLNSPFDKFVLSGRSIYYGALLYLGHITSDLWLSVFAQAAIFVYLTYLLAVIGLRFSVLTLLWVDLTVLIITPVSFYISYLMPDIFASFLILGVIILVPYWNALRVRDRTIVAAIVTYSALVHSSHLLLLTCLVCALLCISFIQRRRSSLQKYFSAPVIILIGSIVCGILGEFIFAYGTRLAIGAYPVRPPFLMARIIADGPGYRFLTKNCATKSYVVCRYIDRLPGSAQAFLWSTDPSEGVFSVVDPATRVALSSEQTSFVLSVMLFDPIGILVGAGRDAIHQFINVGIDKLILNQTLVEGFKLNLPISYSEKLLHTHIVLDASLKSPAKILYSSVYLMSILGLALMLVFWPWVQARTDFDHFPQLRLRSTLTLTLIAIAFNAAICGGLSEPIERYQTRVSWIPLFAALLIIAQMRKASLRIKS